MDPLTLTVATLLATKALENVGGEAGRSAWAGMARLIGVVRRKFGADTPAAAALQQAQRTPNDPGSIQRLAEALQRHVERDPDFHTQLTTWLDEARDHQVLSEGVTKVANNERVGAIIAAQVVHGGVHLSMDSPPQSMLRAPHVPAQLPPDVTNFTGRQAELARLRNALPDQGAGGGTIVISAIAGTAGVGKSALAVHLAHELAPRFFDGQLFVNLHGYDPVQRLQPARVLDRFLRALGVAHEQVPSEVDEQAALYRALLTGKRVLVVLDNASSADQVRLLLPASSTCLVLVTSRNTLGGLIAYDGAEPLTLDVLTAKEAIELLANIIGDDQVGREPQAAAEVTRLCGYLPLAVRIAGAKVVTRPGLTLTELARRLADEQDRLEELTVDDVAVHASFTLSYQTLVPDAARMFRRLGLIAGPDFAVGVAAALAGITVKPAERLVEALVDAHLLESAGTPGRYTFHDLLRLYARERVRTEESDQDRIGAVRRMFDWYLTTVEDADRFPIPGHRRLPRETGQQFEPVFSTRTEALGWLEVERANLVAATRHAAEYGLWAVAWQLADALWCFFQVRKHWTDWQETHELGLAAARRAGDRRAEAWMLTGLGAFYRELRRFEEALECHESALAIAREIGDPSIQGRTLLNLGNVYHELGRSGEAIDTWEQCLPIRRECRDRFGEAVTLANLSDVYAEVGRFEEAIGCGRQALEIVRALENRWGEGNVLMRLGNIHRRWGRIEEAIDYCREALQISRRNGDRHTEGMILDSLGRALEQTHDIRAARACWREALDIFTELEAPEVDEVRTRLERVRDLRSLG